MCVSVKTGSELVQRCSAAQSKFSVDTQDKRSCLLAVTRPWQYCILNRKPLFPGRRPDPRDSSESTKPKLLTVRDLPLRWGRAATVGAGTNPPRQTEGPNTIRSAPGRRTGQAAPLCLQCKEAETAMLTAQVPGTSLLLRRPILPLATLGRLPP